MNAAAAAPAKLKVFLVDDSDDTRHVLAQLLQVMGYEVQTAGSMQAALRDFPGSGSDVLLSDLGLPDGDGWQLLKALRSAGSHPFAIAMSGFGTLADITASTSAGYRYHLVKPIEWPMLKQLLDGVRTAAADGVG